MNDTPAYTIQLSLTVKAPLHKAFDTFVLELHQWWPPAYTWSGNALDIIAIEPRSNGRCYERGPFNFACDWGRVLHYNPPHAIVFTWQIGADRVPQPDPDKASEIEVTFHHEGTAQTKIHFEHRLINRHGKGAADYYKALNAPEGWPYILNRYVELMERSPVFSSDGR